ncbi:hypothetical protein ACO0K9_00165 [Undibacterium sp. Ji50W]|uniref:hypothetical protein n=1 Tax=Undibacterium sp. Ji50W TaxID=3413041 RepID=UPI003BF194C8
MAYVLVIVGALLLIGLSAMNAMSGMYEEAMGFGVFGVMLVAFTLIYIYYIKPANEHLSRDKLIEWLTENSKKITDKGAEFNGVLVTKDSVLVRYCIVYSAVFFTRKAFSNYCIQGSKRSIRVGLISTIFNLIMGWWGIPWGLIYTPQSLYINLAKTESISVEKLLAKKI